MVGDVMLDEYVWGRVSRVSPEAPVMIVDADSHTFVPGGAANVVNNVCALGAKAVIAGIVGTDSAAATLKEKLVEEGADVAGLVAVSERPTTLKTRVIAHTQQGAQQVVRVDHERRDAISADVQARLLFFSERSDLRLRCAAAFGLPKRAADPGIGRIGGAAGPRSGQSDGG